MTADEFTAENYGTYTIGEDAAATIAAEVQDYYEYELAAAADEAYHLGLEDGGRVVAQRAHAAASAIALMNVRNGVDV